VKAGVVAVGYQRDATERIVSRTETPSGGAATTIRYGYTGPGDTSDLTLSASNAVLERVVTLPGGASYTARGAGSVWSYPNLHGDNIAVTNNTGVKQGVTTFYDPFGNLIAGTLPDNVSGGLDNGWLGQHQRPVETAAGLQTTIEMGARPYNPILGRFLGVDPVEGGTPNAYTYVDDPVNEFDLNGQWGWPKIPNPIKAIKKAATKVGGAIASGTKTVVRKTYQSARFVVNAGQLIVPWVMRPGSRGGWVRGRRGRA
jgi:large repetitive protein